MISNESRKKEAKRLEDLAPSCVFTISAPTYVKRQSKELTDYNFMGVEAYEISSYKDSPSLSAMGGLAKKCEELKAETIVEVKPAVLPYVKGVPYSNDRIYLIGTALIPRKD